MAAEANRTYEYIVVGLGGIGSGALYWLSKRVGPGVLGIEQFKLGHNNGGSQDHSRIIRLMYHDERYTKLTPYTYECWSEVEKESGIQLVWKTGSLDLTKRGSPREHVLEEYADAMTKQNVPYERLTAEGIRRKYPQFTVGENIIGLYQADGGLVDAAMGNAVHVQMAQSHGAHVIDQCPVTSLEATPDGGALVHTAQGTFRCRRLIVTAGAWINQVLTGTGQQVPIAVTQEQVTYYATPNTKEFTKDRFPIYIYHADTSDIYGLPIHGNSGSKIGVDCGGPVVGANTRNFIPDPIREKACADFLQKNIPRSLGPKMYTKTCLYTMTMDRHFVVDTLAKKGKPQIIVCCGAGHAYKFASLLGKILSELACDGRTQYPIDKFSIDREAINNPNFKPEMILQPNLVDFKSQL